MKRGLTTLIIFITFYSVTSFGWVVLPPSSTDQVALQSYSQACLDAVRENPQDQKTLLLCSPSNKADVTTKTEDSLGVQSNDSGSVTN